MRDHKHTHITMLFVCIALLTQHFFKRNSNCKRNRPSQPPARRRKGFGKKKIHTQTHANTHTHTTITATTTLHTSGDVGSRVVGSAEDMGVGSTVAGGTDWTVGTSAGAVVATVGSSVGSTGCGAGVGPVTGPRV